MSVKLSSEKRPWYISWDEYFMGVALITAQRSKDPVTQVGSCIVNTDKRIISTGYNGMPNGCSDDTMPWGKHQPDKLRNKQLYDFKFQYKSMFSYWLGLISKEIREKFDVKYEPAGLSTQNMAKLASSDGSSFRNTSLQCSTEKPKNEKRSDYLSWKEYFMGIALITAQRSKDPKRQVGSCIVNTEKRIIGTGYNGMPNGCSDDVLPWGKDSPDALGNKTLYVCHSEMNAIVNKMSSDVRGSTIYVTLFPCNECAKLIIQAGIKKVVYYEEYDKPATEASKKMLNIAGVKTRQYKPTGRNLKIGDVDSTL